MWSQGLVELPREIRDALGLEPGSCLEIRVEDGRIILQPIPNDGLSSDAEAWQDDRQPGLPGSPREGIERPREFYDRIARHKDFREILKRLA
jgi:AbrB family looped-hinge helix DNA binding protein